VSSIYVDLEWEVRRKVVARKQDEKFCIHYRFVLTDDTKDRLVVGEEWFPTKAGRGEALAAGVTGALGLVRNENNNYTAWRPGVDREAFHADTQ